MGAGGVKKRFEEGQKQEQALTGEVRERLLENIKKNRAEGKDTTAMENQLKRIAQEQGIDYKDINPLASKSEKQILGEAVGVLGDILIAGFFGSAEKGAKTGKLLTKTPTLIKAAGKLGISTTIPQITKATAKSTLQAVGQGAARGFLEHAPIGAAFGLSSALKDEEDLGGIVKRTLLGGAISGTIGAAIGGFVGRKNIENEVMRRKAVEQYQRGLNATKEKFKEKGERIIPELLEERWWGTRKKLLEKAEKGVRLSLDEYRQLGELKGAMELQGLVGQIDDEIARFSQGGRIGTERVVAINNVLENQVKARAKWAGSMGIDQNSSRAIQSAHSDIIKELRAKGINDFADALENNVDLRLMNSLDEYQRHLTTLAQDYMPKPISVNAQKVKALQNIKTDLLSLNVFNDVGKNPTAYAQDVRELASQYGQQLYDTRRSLQTISDNQTLSQVKKVDASIRELLNTKYPEYSAINKVYHRSSELYDILNETAKRKGGRGLVSLMRSVLFSGGGSIGAQIAGLPGAILGSTGAIALGEMFNSTWYNTFNAVQKAKIADRIAQYGIDRAPQIINYLQKVGVKGVFELDLLGD